MVKKYTIKDMKELAEFNNGKFLSNKYIGMRNKYKWECSEGHIWEATAGNIKYHNAWCPYCAGNAPKTMQDMQKLAKSKKGVCLSKKYINDNSKLKWKCSEGHIWKASPGSIKQGSWCPHCAGQIIDIKDLKKYAEEHNGQCLSKKYINVKTQYKWHCDIHNVDFFKSWTSIKNKNSWCPACARERIRRKLLKCTIQDMQKLAKENRGKCLSKKYTNNTTHLLWQCEKKHIWKATPKNVKKGHWCPKCANIQSGKNQRGYTIKDMKEIVQKRGGRCLSQKYINMNTKLKWECEHQHIWETTPSKIIHRKQWCPYCARRHVAIEDIYECIKNRDIELLSEEYITSQTKYKWKCKICDEIWVASFNNIQKGSGCPYCSSFKSENEFREVIEKYFNAKFPKVRPRWLKNPQTNYCLELDGYNEELKIAFEYQGEQHFKVVGNNYFGDKEELVKRQKYDLIKKELCKEKNIILLCPTYELDKSEYKQFIKYHIK